MSLLTADPYSESLVAESPRPRSWEVDALINVKLVYTFQGYIERIVHIILAVIKAMRCIGHSL